MPYSEIGVLVVESLRTTMTSSVATHCATNGCVLVVCDAQHMPSSIALPFDGNTLFQQRLQAQLATTLPLKKQLWKRVVEAKLRNQAANLPNDSSAQIRLEQMAANVRSGDPENKEAQGARLYWQHLFHSHEPLQSAGRFRRMPDGPAPNGLLNYGYAILRAAVARAIVSAGLLPSLGIHHHGRGNAFCLADDLMEPYRPWVDAGVLCALDRGECEVSRDSRIILLEVLTESADTPSGGGPLLVAIERTASSLAKLLERAANHSNRQNAANLAAKLILPSWPPP